MTVQNEIFSASEVMAMRGKTVSHVALLVQESHSQPLYTAKKAPYSSMLQQELFALDPIHEPLRQRYFERLPRALAEQFGWQYFDKLKNQKLSQVETADWFQAEMARKMPRVEAVLGQYCDIFAFLKKSYQELDFLAELGDDVYYAAMQAGLVEVRAAADKAQQRGIEKSTEEWAALSSQQAVKKIKKNANAKGIALPMHVCRLESSATYLKQHGIKPLAYQTETQLKNIALVVAYRFRQQRDDYLAKHHHKATDKSSAYAVMLECYREMMRDIEQLHIEAHCHKKAKKGTLRPEELITGMLKMTCDKWWFSKLNKMAKRMKEHLAIACGKVNMLTPYCSNTRLQEFEAQRKANIEYLRSMIIINVAEPEEQLSLFDTWLKSSSCPKIKRLELLTRMNGFEEYADLHGHEGWFITFTAPSKYHAMLSKTNSINPKWNGASPADTQRYLVNTWAKIRAKLNREGIMAYGFRVAEPHADATPHWHLVLFTTPEQMQALRRIILSYALAEDGTEAGAKKYRCHFKKIDKEKGTATGYLIKYVSKNIDGFGMEDELSDESNLKAKESARRAEAWSSTWGIRQFQQLGNVPISLWREFRRLGDTPQVDETLEQLRVVANEGKWNVFTELLGGALVKRIDLPARLTYTERTDEKGEAKYTLYQEPSFKVSGVINSANGVRINTRPKAWAICLKPDNWEVQQQAKKLANATEQEQEAFKQKQYEKLGFNAEALALLGELAPPWTRVSNCTGSKNEQISEHARNCLRNELITMRGRVTEQQIDDLLNGKRLKIWGNSQKTLFVTFSRGGLVEHIVENSDHLFY